MNPILRAFVAGIVFSNSFYQLLHWKLGVEHIMLPIAGIVLAGALLYKANKQIERR